jgi:hypothetical protein
MADNDNDNEDELQLNAEQEQERRLADAQRKIAASERLQKLILVLKKKEKLPSETGNEIDGLVEEFLDKVEINILNLLCSDGDPDSEDYRGLDSDRDTAQEVETAIRFFPDILSRRIEYYNEGYDRNYLYPIHFMAFAWNPEEEEEEGEETCYRCNVKTVSFVPVVARLAIELGSFEEQYRGGLLCADDDGNNVLNILMCTINPKRHKNNWEHHELADTKYLQVLIQLRQMGLLKKEDINRYDMLSRLCFNQDFYFAEKRFRFLIEWDPTELIRRDEYGCVPLDYAAINFPSIEMFRFILECGMRYFPKKKGISLPFQEDMDNETPFQEACKKYGHKQVMMVISDTLNNPVTPLLNSADALLSAAIDDSIHLDCVYLLVRREPDVLQKLLSQSLAVVTSAGSNNNKNNSNNNTKNDDVTSPCKLVENKLDSTTERKRKR